MDKDTGEIIEPLNIVLAKMATKDDFESVRAELRAEIHEGFTGLQAELHDGFADIRAELKDIRRQRDALEFTVQNISGFAKEIDHLIERVSAIEKHLGLHAKFAA